MLQTPDLPKGVATVVNVHLEIDASPAAAPGKWMRSFPAFTEIENPVIVASDMNTSGTNGSPTSSHREILNLGNPLIDDLMIPLGSKDLWSMSEPKNDSQFAASYSDPQLARLQFHFRRAYPCSPSSGFFIPQHLRRTRNHGGPAGDQAGFSNGRRVSADVSDIMLRILSGLYAGPSFRFNFGDGVNTNDVPFQETFPYVAWVQNGGNRPHIDPGEAGCTQGSGLSLPRQLARFRNNSGCLQGLQPVALDLRPVPADGY